jgi:ATP-dependent RNA circularization protein (DNA/RNA ligase family)
MSQQTVDEEFELRHRKIMKRMTIEEVDERFRYIIRPLQRRLRDLGPDPGYTTENWMACL